MLAFRLVALFAVLRPANGLVSADGALTSFLVDSKRRLTEELQLQMARVERLLQRSLFMSVVFCTKNSGNTDSIVEVGVGVE